MKRTIRSTYTSLCIALLSTGSSPALAQSEPPTYGDTLSQLVRFCVVYLEVEGTLPDGSTIPRLEGTGFFVTHDAHVVTAKHVAMSKSNWATHTARLQAMRLTDQEYVRQNFRIQGRLDKKDAQAFELELLRAHENADIAVLRLKPQKAETAEIRGRNWPVLPIASNLSPGSRGMRVAAWGFPQGNTWAQPYGSEFNRARILHFGHMHEGNELVATDETLQPGTSGGPVYNRRGEIVGVIYGGRDLSPTAYFTPGNVLAGFLTYLGIRP